MYLCLQVVGLKDKVLTSFLSSIGPLYNQDYNLASKGHLPLMWGGRLIWLIGIFEQMCILWSFRGKERRSKVLRHGDTENKVRTKTYLIERICHDWFLGCWYGPDSHLGDKLGCSLVAQTVACLPRSPWPLNLNYLSCRMLIRLYSLEDNMDTYVK